jgi:hypothetical protein
MKPFIFNHWHCWESNGKILLSDESVKKLRYFKNTDDCINFLWLEGHKDTARALNKHAKGQSK